MKRPVITAGHTEPLFVRSYSADCGGVKRGVAFHFGGEGGWVVDLADLRAIVEEATLHQRAMDAPPSRTRKARAK